MNYNLLKSKMVLAGDKVSDLATCLGVTSSTISSKFIGRCDFSRVDIKKIIDKYNLSAEDVMAIFFN